MDSLQSDGWRWSNVPVPEPHVVGLLIGMTLHAIRPWYAFENQRYLRVGGAGLLGASLLVIGWSVRTVGVMSVEKPDRIVTGGPYAYSRNPMYVAWTGVYTGVALVLNSVWLLILLPVVIGRTHTIIRREERALARDFGDTYLAYRRTVRRYL